MRRSKLVVLRRNFHIAVVTTAVLGMPIGGRALLLAAEPPTPPASTVPQGADSGRRSDSALARGAQLPTQGTVPKDGARSTQPAAQPTSLTILAGVLFAVAIVFAVLMVWELWRGGNVSVTTHWGGFGGGQGGWQLSPGFVFLIGVLIFGGLASLAMLRERPPAASSNVGASVPATDSGAVTGKPNAAGSTAATQSAIGSPPPPAGAPKQ